MTRNLLASLALAVVSLVVFLGLLELFAARAESDLPEWLARRNPLSDSGIEVRDPDLFWRYRPNVDLVGSYPLEGNVRAKPIRVRTNAFGLRARDIDLVLIHPAYRPSRPHRCVLTELARELGVPVVEMERIVRETGLPKSETFLDIYHPSALVHRRLAEELARAVRPRIPPSGVSASMAPRPN